MADEAHPPSVARPARPALRRTARGALVVLALIVVAVVIGRGPLLAAIGRGLIAEDALAPVDVIVLSNASARADALEAARLYGEGVSARLAVPQWADDPLDAELRCRGVQHLGVTELARTILEHSGVPPDAIAVIPGAVEGTEDEVLAVADYVRAQGLGSVLYLAPRTHTARARWLLRRRVPAEMRVAVRSSPLDDFAADRWWRSRDQSREVMSEYLRWVNSAVFGDMWHGTARVARAPASCSCCDTAAVAGAAPDAGGSPTMRER